MSGFKGLAIAACVGSTTAAVLWGVAAFGRTPDISLTLGEVAPALVAYSGGTALQYAQALQEGNWNEAIGLTGWMRERLDLVAASGEGEGAIEEARAALVKALQERTVSGNQLREEGIEDQYVFAPGTTVEVLRRDRGRDDLEAPVAERVWLRVTYPQKTRALRDLANIPLRSVVAGVNVSDSGSVLKANIIGNLDLDWSSFSYEWDSPAGD